MTETGELTRDDLVIDPDMEIDDDGKIGRVLYSVRRVSFCKADV